MPRYDMAERQVQPLAKAPRPGEQQAASLAYDSGTSMGACPAVPFALRQYSSHSAGLFSHLRWRFRVWRVKLGYGSKHTHTRGPE